MPQNVGGYGLGFKLQVACSWAVANLWGASVCGPFQVAPACMVALCGASATGADKLVTGGSDGSLALWDPLIQASGPGGVKEVAPQGVAKAHEGGVTSMALAPPMAGQPLGQAASLRLITLGKRPPPCSPGQDAIPCEYTPVSGGSLNCVLGRGITTCHSLALV